ncbi:MAG: choice-of-anchor J domain-containing protein [Clostridia bacterium]|nr:choice-of-anchor J domain-containing protein [Clostridia bacterium]
MKKILSLLVAFCLLFGLVPAAFAKTEAPAETKELTTVASWDFETDAAENGWIFTDADGDGNNWSWVEDGNNAHSGSHAIRSDSYLNGTALTPDNWAISPEFTLPEGEAQLSLWIRNFSATYPETFRIYIGDGNGLVPATDDMEVGSGYENITVDVSAYAGTTTRLAIRHYNCTDQFRMYVDDVQVLASETGGPGEDPYVIDVIEVDGFKTPVEGMTCAEWVDGLTVPENANYAISSIEAYGADGILYDDDVLVAGETYLVGCMLEPIGDYTFALDATLIGYNGSDEIELDMDYSRVASSLEAWIVPAEMICEPDPGTPISALDVALNVDGSDLLHFNTEGDYPWVTVEEGDRFYAKSSNEGASSSTSDLTLTVDAIEGDILVFDFKAWGEGNSTAWDKCQFIDGNVTVFTFGALDNDWETYEYTMTAGTHNFIWRYQKDSSVNPTGDYFAIDNVDVITGLVPPVTPPVTDPPETEVPVTEPPVDDLDAALNVEGGTLHFETEETYPWIVLEDEERMWAQSGNAGVHNSTSTLTLTVTVEEGQMLTFEYKAWGEGSSDSYDWDKCRFYVDGEIQFDYGAHQNDWLDYTTSALTAGEHVFTWTYKKDGSTNPTGDYFAVDNVELLAAGTPIEEHIIHEIVIDGFTVPEWNANPDYVVTVPEDAPYSVGYCDWNWYYEDDYEDGDILPENGVFDDEEKLYYMYISINPDSGWTVAEDVVITINGETGYVVNSGYVASSNLVWIYTINFTVTEPTEPGDIAIHEVWVDGFGTPVAGVAGIDHMFLTTPDDAPYFIVYGGWRDETDQQQMWSEEHVFIPGHYYSEGCQIWAEEGYYFAEDCVFYVNGGTELVDEQWSYVDEADNWICYVNILPVECLGTPMLLGDVDLDGEVTVSDALLAMRYAMGLVELTEQQLDQLDVNFDGEYDLVDATLILRYAMGLIEEFPLPVGV